VQEPDLVSWLRTAQRCSGEDIGERLLSLTCPVDHPLKVLHDVRQCLPRLREEAYRNQRRERYSTAAWDAETGPCHHSPIAGLTKITRSNACDLGVLKQDRRANAGGKVRAVLTLDPGVADPVDPRRDEGASLIDNLVRERARRMLAQAVRQSVSDLGAVAIPLAWRRSGDRSGPRPPPRLTRAGAPRDGRACGERPTAARS